jgi:putative oxidoreductase
MSMTLDTTPVFANRTVKIISWVLQALLAATFIAAGGAKLAGAPMMVEIFDHIGLGQWFRLVTGAVEVLGGIALLVPAAAAFGAFFLGVTMICAVLTHLLVIGGNPTPAIVLAVLNFVVVFLRRMQFAALLS